LANSEKDKKYVIRNTIVSKTMYKKVKRQKQKQEIKSTNEA